MKDLVTALSGFHAAVGRVLKTSKADRYRYADLATVLDTVRGPLLDNGLVVSQLFDGDALITRLMHVSGEFLESRMNLPVLDMRGMNAAQALGSAISYCRRYALLAILCLAAEDDDGAGSGPVRGQTAAHPAAPSPTEEIVQLQQRLGLSVEAVKTALAEMGVMKVAQLDPDGVEALKTHLVHLSQA